MKNWLAVVSAGALVGLAASAVADNDRDQNNRKRVFRTKLVGLDEVPSVSSKAKGEFYAIVNKEGTAFTYWLSYSGLEFAASQSHIHFGQHHTNGGISVWLCQSNVSPAPSSVAARVAPCPLRATTMPISATITADDVLGPAGQGIAPAEFAELVAAMRAGAAYANVHSGMGGTAPVGFPGGEIRGQIN
jgi:hypothetical protein